MDKATFLTSSSSTAFPSWLDSWSPRAPARQHRHIAGPDTESALALIAAQALGDYQALTARGGRILRVNLGDNAAGGLVLLEEALCG